MKKIGILLMFFATMAVSSCSILSNAARTSAGATGSATAKALVSLYNSRQTNGNISITNSYDLSNILTVINGAQALRTNQADLQFKTNFITGLVSGGSGMITNTSANNIVSNLLSSTAFANVNASNITQKVETVTAIISLLNMLR